MTYYAATKPKFKEGHRAKNVVSVSNNTLNYLKAQKQGGEIMDDVIRRLAGLPPRTRA
jgi:hypothetical protein